MQYTFKTNLQLREDFQEYAEYLPFLYDHREEIYTNSAYFYARLPYTIYGLNKAVCIGAILKAFDKGNPYHIVSEDGKREEFIAAYAGNPMTGTTTGLKVIVANNMVEVQRFSYCGFLSLVHRLAVCFKDCGLPYIEPTHTVHDVIQRLLEDSPQHKS